MRKSTVLFGIVCALCAGSTLWMWRELENEKARADSLEFLLAQDHVPKSSPLAARPVAQVPRQSAEPAIPPAPTKDVSDLTDTQTRMGAHYAMERQRRLLNNPEFRNAIRSQQRAMFEAAFHDLQKSLGLSPDKAAKIFDLMADQAVDQGGSWADLGGETDTEQRRLAFDEKRRKDDAAMNELLGESGMEKWREYRKTYQSRIEVNQLRSELSSGPEPLRDDQFEPMLAAVYAEQQRVDQELADFESASSPDVIGSGATDTKRAELAIAANGRIVDSARSILSSTQLATLADFYRRQNEQMKAQSVLIRLNNQAMIREAQARKAQ